MNEQIKKTKIAEYFIDETASIFTQHWFNAHDDMPDSDYMDEMYNYLEFVEKYKPKRALINTKQFYYTISPLMQEWVDENISIKAHKIITKIAFILPDDLFTQVSIEQTMDEKEASKYKEISFFSNRNDAINWLKI